MASVDLVWLRGVDLNHRPLGYEPNELPDCSTPQSDHNNGAQCRQSAPFAAETTRIPRVPRGREEAPVQISRLLDAHQVIIRHCRQLSRRASGLGDDGTNDMVVSDALRTNELQAWFLSEHLVEVPLVHAEEPPIRKAG